ncbi:MAG: phage portal protein [Clostridia bacterium]|nr:phage portal protein [Clostridia bacterium]MBR4576533.1 phage portal protein [Clostridia bacterium]
MTNQKEHDIVNDPEALEALYQANRKDIWAGFNSRHYDQYIFKGILCGFDPKKINDWIILKQRPGYMYSSLLRNYPLNNYDVMNNVDRGLKTFEGFMGNNIKETSVPFDIDRKLTAEEIAETVKYCRHDVEQTIQVFLIRVYSLIDYSGTRDETIVEKVEVYDETGISYFQLEGGHLVAEEPYHEAYFTVDGVHPFNWTKIPLIPFKRDADEIPLIRNVKSLQDGLNDILSNFENNMEEDSRNTILILVNYDGENLGTFRKNLANYGAVKVKTVDGAPGDLKTLQIEVNAENYKAILEIFKKAIIENAMGFDAKDDRLGGQPNQMNIQSMYSDIDLDANDMETEFQASFEELLWFVRCHFSNIGVGDFDLDNLEIIFNRDLPMVESEVINNIRNSIGILSDETLVAQHPWVDDVQMELKRKAKQQQEEHDALMGNDPFKKDPDKKGDDE